MASRKKSLGILSILIIGCFLCGLIWVIISTYHVGFLSGLDDISIAINFFKAGFILVLINIFRLFLPKIKSYD